MKTLIILITVFSLAISTDPNDDDYENDFNEVEDLTPLRGLNRLIRLRVNANQVRRIEVLLELQALVTVDLRDNPLDEDGLEALLEALEEAKVRVAL